MKSLVIGLAILIAFLVWFGLRRSKPLKHKIALSDVAFHKILSVLFYRGYEGGLLIIQARGGQPFIQFLKYIDDAGVGIRSDFPLAPWSKGYFDRLRQSLDQRSTKYSIYDVPESESLNNPVTKFIEIDFGQDLDAASELARLTLVDVFNLNPDEILTYYFEGVSPKDEKIGFD